MKSAWIRITDAGNIPLREGRAVEIQGREIAIFNLGDRFLAVENRCPHRGGPLADGIVSGCAVVCPMHAWRVDLEEGSVAKPREELACVTRYPVRIDDGIVSIQLRDARLQQDGVLDIPRAMAREHADCPAGSIPAALESAAG